MYGRDTSIQYITDSKTTLNNAYKIDSHKYSLKQLKTENIINEMRHNYRSYKFNKM